MKILVPTDFSDTSLNANSFAIELAQALDGEIIFFHAYHFPVTDPIAPAYGNTGSVTQSSDLMKEHENNIKNQMINICSDVRTRTENSINCDFIYKPGFLMDQVLETIEEIQCDLVVMGTKGASGIKDAIFGSNAVSILEKSKCPVLAIPKTVKLKPMKNLIYASDYHDSDAVKIGQLIKFFEPLHPEIHVVHIAELEDPESEQKKFENKLKHQVNYPSIHYHIYKDDDVIEGLGNAVKELDTDLVAMTTRKKGFLEGLFSKSLTKKMVYHADIPLLVFNE